MRERVVSFDSFSLPLKKMNTYIFFQSLNFICNGFLCFVSLPSKKWTPTSYEENFLIIPIFSRILASFYGSHQAIGKDKNMATSLVLLFEPCEFRTLLIYFYLWQSKKCVSGWFLWLVSLSSKKWTIIFANVRNIWLLLRYFFRIIKFSGNRKIIEKHYHWIRLLLNCLSAASFKLCMKW